MIMSATAFRTAMDVVELLISEVEAGGWADFSLEQWLVICMTWAR